MRLLRALYGRVEHLVHELAKFGTVGAVAYVVDVGLFNLLSLSVLDHQPLTAKAISTVVAMSVAYVGNRQWTFRHRDRSTVRREYPLFAVLNGIGMIIALTCLWFSHYVLGFTSALADNIAANIVGIGLASMFRFWAYRRWVFRAIAPIAEREEPVGAA